MNSSRILFQNYTRVVDICSGAPKGTEGNIMINTRKSQIKKDLEWLKLTLYEAKRWVYAQQEDRLPHRGCPGGVKPDSA
jgi:hypothetical protein